MAEARTMPYAPEAEAALLGTMMVYGGAARTAFESGLVEDQFYLSAHQCICHALFSLYQEGKGTDLAAAATRLQDENELDHVGGLSYLTSLTNAAVTSANTRDYVQIIQDKALVRRMIETADQISKDGLGGVEDINDYLDGCEKAVLDVSRRRRTSEFQTSAQVISSVMEQIRKMSDNHSDITGLKTGFADFDHLTHGLQAGDLDILAARPSMGKTAVMLNFALNVASYQRDKAVAVFSLEMSAEQLGMRLLSAASHVPGDLIKTGRLEDGDNWQLVSAAAQRLQKLKLYIDDTPGTRVADIFSKCRRLQQQEGLSLVLVDYIQLISGSRGQTNDYNRQQEVSEISRSLKSLARELNVPVIALSQLSRAVESRENKRPMLSDLRESGAIEQDADIVMMLYRDSYYNDAAKLEADKTGSEPLELNIAKHRNGATRMIKLMFEPRTNALMNIAHESGPQG
jgi:replicative DNA helicase